MKKKLLIRNRLPNNYRDYNMFFVKTSYTDLIMEEYQTLLLEEINIWKMVWDR